MNQQQSPETEFARRLRAELRSIVVGQGAVLPAQRTSTAARAGRAWRRPGSRLGLAAAAVAAVIAAVLIVNASGDNTPAAFAVEAEGGGEISVEIRSLEDASGLEQALTEAGVPASVDYLATGMTCREPRFQRAPWPEGARAISMARISGDGPFEFSGPLHFSISRGAVGSGQTLVIVASAGPEGLFSTSSKVELADGVVAPCEPIPDQKASGPGASR